MNDSPISSPNYLNTQFITPSRKPTQHHCNADKKQNQFCKLDENVLVQIRRNLFQQPTPNKMLGGAGDYAKKQLFGSLDKNKLPANLVQYSCELIIEDYLQGRQASQRSYFKFTPKYSSKAEPFTIQIDNISSVKNLVYGYRILEKEGEDEGKFLMGEKMEFKIQSSIKTAPKPKSNLQEIDQSQDEYYPDEDLEIRVLELGGDSYSIDNNSSSKCIEPSEIDRGRIRGELIQFFHLETNRKAKLKDIKAYLIGRGYKVSEAKIKSLIEQVCKVGSDKKSGYTLKDQYIEKDQYERKAPKKRIKQD